MLIQWGKSHQTEQGARKCQIHSGMMGGQLWGSSSKGQSFKTGDEDNSEEWLHFLTAWDNVFSIEPAYQQKW